MTTGAGVSCPEDVANTFLAIHQSVAKESQTGASSTKITGQLDLVIIIDEGALKPAQHYWVKQLIKILSEIFVISPQYTRVRDDNSVHMTLSKKVHIRIE